MRRGAGVWRSWRFRRCRSESVTMHDRGREGHRLTLTTWDTEVGRLAADRDEVCQDKLELEIKYWTLVFYDSLISSFVRRALRTGVCRWRRMGTSWIWKGCGTTKSYFEKLYNCDGSDN